MVASLAVSLARETFSVYRALIRSSQRAFKGDLQMIAAAKAEIRSHIEKSRSVQDEAQVQELQAQGREAAEFLRTSIMQSSPNERGNWQVELNQEHAGRVVEPIGPESVGKP